MSQTTTKPRAKMREMVHSIICTCGMWEEFPSDMQRHHSQVFSHLENNLNENTATYECPDCNSIVKSTNEYKSDEEN